MIKAQYRKLMRRHATIENVRYLSVDKRRKKATRVTGCRTNAKKTESSNVMRKEEQSSPDTNQILDLSAFIDPLMDFEDIEDFAYFYE